MKLLETLISRLGPELEPFAWNRELRVWTWLGVWSGWKCPKSKWETQGRARVASTRAVTA